MMRTSVCEQCGDHFRFEYRGKGRHNRLCSKCRPCEMVAGQIYAQTCVGCRREFTFRYVGKGPAIKRCPNCRVPSRAHQKRAGQNVMITCNACHEEFGYAYAGTGPLRERCDACNAKFPCGETISVVCCDCGNSFGYLYSVGYPPIRCPECKAIWDTNRKHLRREDWRSCAYTASDWRDALDAFGHRCAYCGSTAKQSRDHFVPFSLGGTTTRGNIVPACSACNSSKRNKDPRHWLLPDKYDYIRSILARLDGTA